MGPFAESTFEDTRRPSNYSVITHVTTGGQRIGFFWRLLRTRQVDVQSCQLLGLLEVLPARLVVIVHPANVGAFQVQLGGQIQMCRQICLQFQH